MSRTAFFFLADDDPDDTLLFEEIVGDCPLPIRLGTAPDGKEALAILRKMEGQLPDILFLDLNMPRMDGKECLREIRSDNRLANIPVVIYTTSSHQRDIDETIALGANGFITKPSDMSDLEKIILTIAQNLPHHLDTALQLLRSNTGTFVTC
ncbi:MAG: response regulator [Saprospiraceae bacterium]|nr:response regulator [Saprospiraceae bacterium]